MQGLHSRHVAAPRASGANGAYGRRHPSGRAPRRVVVTNRLFAAFRRWVVTAPAGTARYWVCLSVVVARLGATQKERRKLLVLALLAPLRDTFRDPSTRRVKLRLNGRELDWCIGPKSDLFIINEILLCNEYGRFEIVEPELVLDLGSHIGVSLLHWRLRFPRARLIGIEPNSVSFTRLLENASQLPAEVHQLAIADRDGEVEFFADRQACLSSLAHAPGRESVTVRARTLDTLIEELAVDQIDLLKLDIEHGETAVLQNSDRLDDIPVIVGEFADGGDPKARAAFFSLFRDRELDIRGDVGEHTVFSATKRGAQRLTASDKAPSRAGALAANT
jgi:FkbM family methyltransferase